MISVLFAIIVVRGFALQQARRELDILELKLFACAMELHETRKEASHAELEEAQFYSSQYGGSQ